MFNKKTFFLILILMIYIVGCGKKTVVNYPEKSNMSLKEAYNLVIEQVKKVYTPRNMEYKEMLVTGDGKSVAFVWKGKIKAFYIRHWLYDGTKPRVEINQEGNTYIVVFKNNGSDMGDCYGYSNSLPVPRPMRFDIYWNDSYRNGCFQYIKFYFNNKDEAVKFAQAMNLIFIENNIADVMYKIEDENLTETKETLKEKEKTEVNEPVEKQSEIKAMESENIVSHPEEKAVEKEKVMKQAEEKHNEKPVEKSEKPAAKTKKRCTVDKIIKMQEIGLTLDEIKRICE